MSVNAVEREDLEIDLKVKRICRFCLTQTPKLLGNIYGREPRLKQSAPLPLQIMACASIEVFTNDGMPQYICIECRLLFEHCYRFKQMCKTAEILLRQVPLTGAWPNKLPKPKYPLQIQKPQKEIADEQNESCPESLNQAKKLPIVNRQMCPKPKNVSDQVSASSGFLPKKLLNADPSPSPEPPVPFRVKKEIRDETESFLYKVENDEELSIDDVHRLIAATQIDEEEINNSEPCQIPFAINKKPKLLNKSPARILNKEAEIKNEPRLSNPQLTCDEEGNVAIVTEIIDTNISPTPEPEPEIPVPTIQTDVFPCPHCERSFPLRQLRDIHLVNHNRERSFQCRSCERSFFSKYDLQKHNVIHTGDKPYKCTVCDKGFTRATLLHRHEKSHTDMPKFVCVHCEKSFLSKEEMEKHAQRHLKIRPYVCNICNKAFAFKQGLERHVLVHSGSQPYPCHYCTQSFPTPSKLSRHLTAHAGKRPYPCKFCSKSYLLSHHLTRHLRSHNDAMSLECTECDKMFKSREDLIYHTKVHVTESLSCLLCKETFRELEEINAHIRLHAEGEAFACEFCDLMFVSARALQSHVQKEHAEDLAAYIADDKEQAKKVQKIKEQQLSLKKSQPKEDSVASLNELQSTFDEFLADDDDNLVVVPKNQPKEDELAEDFEEDQTEKEHNSKHSTKIINQILMKSHEKNYVTFEDGIVMPTEALEEHLEDLSSFELEPAPSKIRKIEVKSPQESNDRARRSNEGIRQLQRNVDETSESLLNAEVISKNKVAKLSKQQQQHNQNFSKTPSKSNTSLEEGSSNRKRSASTLDSSPSTDDNVKVLLRGKQQIPMKRSPAEKSGATPNKRSPEGTPIAQKIIKFAKPQTSSAGKVNRKLCT